MQLLATPGLFTIEVDREPSDGRMFELELLGRAMHEVLNGQIDGYNVADRFAGTALEWSGDVPKKLGVDTTAFDAAGTGEAAATAAVSAHVAAGDPHVGYQLEVEKDAASGYAGLDVNARLLSTRLQLTATDLLIGRSTVGAGASEEIACTAAGRALLDDATAAAQRSTLGLGSAAVEDTSAFDAAGAGEAAATAAVNAHVAAGDPHTGYQLESEKDAASGYAGLDVNARLLSTRLQMTATDLLVGRSTAAAGASEEIACTAAGRALLDDATAAAQRTTLGLGSIATQPIDAYDSAGTAAGLIVTHHDPGSIDHDERYYTETEVDTKLNTHVADADPHAGYQLESGKDVASGYAGLDANARLLSTRLQLTATDLLVGRSTVGAGASEEIACTAAGRALLDDASAAAQRTTLGLVIGTDVQAQDAELQAIAGLASAAGKIIEFTGSGTAQLIDTPAGGGGDMLAANNLSDLVNAGAARANLGVAIGTNVQAQDAELQAISGLMSAAGKLIEFTGSGTAQLIATPDNAWEEVVSGTVSASTSFSLTGLDGDTDEIYQLFIRSVQLSNVAESFILLRPNGGTGDLSTSGADQNSVNTSGSILWAPDKWVIGVTCGIDVHDRGGWLMHTIYARHNNIWSTSDSQLIFGLGQYIEREPNVNNVRSGWVGGSYDAGNLTNITYLQILNNSGYSTYWHYTLLRRKL